MDYIFLIIVGLVGILLGIFAGQRKKINKVDSLEKANDAIRQKKETAKEKIMNLIQEKDQITNDDVENLLEVSDATATNYLEELEKEGKIVQRGETGRGVFYTLKNG